jgi:hypothetical protein
MRVLYGKKIEDGDESKKRKEDVGSGGPGPT